MTPNPNKQSVDKLDDIFQVFYSEANIKASEIGWEAIAEAEQTAKQAIQAHIAEEVRKAKIDELEKIHVHINRNLGNYHAYKDRLNQLKSLQGEE